MKKAVVVCALFMTACGGGTNVFTGGGAGSTSTTGGTGGTTVSSGGGGEGGSGGMATTGGSGGATTTTGGGGMGGSGGVGGNGGATCTPIEACGKAMCGTVDNCGTPLNCGGCEGWKGDPEAPGIMTCGADNICHCPPVPVIIADPLGTYCTGSKADMYTKEWCNMYGCVEARDCGQPALFKVGDPCVYSTTVVLADNAEVSVWCCTSAN